MSRILSSLVIVIVLGAAGLFYASPIIAFYDIRSACQSEDIGSLAKLIDFDAVRASLKTQLDAGDAGVAAPPPSALNDPLGATGNALKDVANSVGNAFNSLVNPAAPKAAVIPVVDVESYLKPKAILALTYGLGKDAYKTDPLTLPAKAPRPKMAFFSLEHARLTVNDGAHNDTTFTFERHGITHWQLVHIGLPQPTPPPVPVKNTNASPAG